MDFHKRRTVSAEFIMVNEKSLCKDWFWGKGEVIWKIMSFLLCSYSHAKNLIRNFKVSYKQIFLKTEEFQKWNIHGGRMQSVHKRKCKPGT